MGYTDSRMMNETEKHEAGKPAERNENMLTDTQIEQVIAAADELGYGVTERQVTGTRDELGRYGQKIEYRTLRDRMIAGRAVREIEGAQTRAGQPRYTLVIVDFGDVRGIAQF